MDAAGTSRRPRGQKRTQLQRERDSDRKRATAALSGLSEAATALENSRASHAEATQAPVENNTDIFKAYDSLWRNAGNNSAAVVAPGSDARKNLDSAMTSRLMAWASADAQASGDKAGNNLTPSSIPSALPTTLPDFDDGHDGDNANFGAVWVGGDGNTLSEDSNGADH